MSEMPTSIGRPTMGRPFGLVSSTGGGSVTPNAAQRVTDWYIDPAQTHGGSDQNNGLTATTPIKSIAEWRRRITGARYGATGFATGPIIHVMSSSAVKDDGMFYGFTCEQATNFIKLMAVPTVVGTGSVTAYTPYVGNARGSLTDAALPVSWTASGFVTTTSRSRFIRKTGGGAQPYAPVLLDLGAKSVQLGVTVNLDDTAFPFVPSVVETDFVIGNNYEILSFPSWPLLQCAPFVNIGGSCIDFAGGTVINPMTGTQRYQISGFVGAGLPFATNPGGTRMISCVFAILQPAAAVFGGCGWFFNNCGFLNTALRTVFGGADENAPPGKNVFINCVIDFNNGSRTSIGTCRMYDFTVPLLNVQYGSGINLTGAIVGSGNSGKLVSVQQGGLVTGAALITATTSDGSPYQVSTVSYTTPVVDGGTGDGIYS